MKATEELISHKYKIKTHVDIHRMLKKEKQYLFLIDFTNLILIICYFLIMIIITGESYQSPIRENPFNYCYRYYCNYTITPISTTIIIIIIITLVIAIIIVFITTSIIVVNTVALF